MLGTRRFVAGPAGGLFVLLLVCVSKNVWADAVAVTAPLSSTSSTSVGAGSTGGASSPTVAATPAAVSASVGAAFKAESPAAQNDVPLPPNMAAPPPLSVPALPGLLSPTALAAVPAEGLSTPQYLTAVAGNRSVELSWYPALGKQPPAGYLIFRGEDSGPISPAPINLTPVTETFYRDNDDNSRRGPLDRHTYTYRVRAYAADGRLSPYSATATARPSGPLLPPGRFAALPGNAKVQLTWVEPISTGDADLAGYVLLRGGDGGHLAPYRNLGAAALSFTDKGLANGQPLYYALVAVATDHKHSSPTTAARAVPFRALAAPTGLSGVGLGEDLVRLTWNAPPANGTFALKGYNIYRSTGAAVDTAVPLNKVLITDTRYEDDSDNSSAAPRLGTQYLYSVAAVDLNGGLSMPCPAFGAGPVASISKLEAGTFNIMAGNTLQIQGRKTINIANTWILWRQNLGNTYGASSPSSFSLNQQLQVQLSGQVGRKIRVNVDYDDSATSSQQQQISVVYGGDSQAVVKEFAFGDIQMDLDSNRTQFAGYNKSLFGAKLKIDSPDDRLRITAIGAQTQGFTETKTFVGGYEEVMNGAIPGHDYPDSSFIPYKYYFLSREADLVEGTNSIVPGSVVIYIDEPGVSNLSANHVTVPNGPGGTTFNFIPLNPNTDYTVDSKSGLITFNVGIQANYNIAVAYKTAQPDANGQVSEGYNNNAFDFRPSSFSSNNLSGVTGGPSDFHLIQFGSQNASTGYDGHMSTQFYSLGDREILDPSLDPNFKFLIYGPNQAVVYQMDPRADYTGVVNFDTTLGIMRFRVPYPFQQGNSGAQMTANPPLFGDVATPYNGGNQDCYDIVQRVNNYTIHVEYQHQMTDYQLRPNIIHSSDVISVDGRHVIRDVDYFLDYDTGILVFNNPDLVKTSSTVVATYEYMPFGSQFTSTVYGGRAEYDFNDNLSVGSTYLNDSANAPQDTPQITSGVYSLQILDGDVQARVPQEALDAVTSVISPRSGFLTIKGSAEAAQSWYDPNTYNRNNENGVAMVDDFESVNSIVSASTLRQNWFPASIPVPLNGDAPNASGRRFTHLYTQMNQAYDAQVLTLAGEDPQVNTLRLDWGNYSSPSNWDGYVYSFGPTPNQSVSQSSQLQIWLQTTGVVTLHVDAGQISEDAVDNGVLETESATGYLAAGEDIGIDNPGTVGSPYPSPQNDPSIYPDPGYWGWNNGILDTEDFDQTGVLDTANNYYSFSVVVSPDGQNGSNGGYQEVNLDMTQQQQLPGVQYGIVGDATQMSTVPGASTYYTNISRVRVWIDGAQASQGSLILQSVQFVGNKWQVRADPNVTNLAGVSATVNTAQFQVQAINESSSLSQTANVPYSPDTDFYIVDSTHSPAVETALELLYALTGADMSTSGEPFYQARRILSAGVPVDFGLYQNMRIDLFKPSYIIGGRSMTSLQGETLLIRLAADDQDYFEYAIPLDGVTTQAWQTVTLSLNGTDGARVQVGQPYLRQINYVSFSIRTFNNSPNYNINTPLNQEALWLNNLRVTDPVVRQGTAKRVNVEYNLMGGKIVVDQSYKDVDSDFIQIDLQDNPPLQHTINQDLNAAINLLPWLPASVDYATDQSFTDGQNQADPFYSLNFTEANVNDDKTTAAVAFNKIPGLSLGVNGYVQHVRQIFLPVYVQTQQMLMNAEFSPDNTQQNTHEQITAAYKVPPQVTVLGNSALTGEVDIDTAQTRYDQPLTVTGSTQFENTATQTHTIKGAYSGNYKMGNWLTLSPSYSYSETLANGNIVAPATLQGDTSAYTLDAAGQVTQFVPQQRVINPALQAQLGNLGPVQNTKVAYNFTQTMDYIQNQMETPGSLNAGTDLNLASLGPAYSKLPDLNFSQSWEVDSVVNDNVTVRGPLESAQLLGGIAGNATLNQQFGSSLAANPNVLSVLPNLALEKQAPWLESVWSPRFSFGGADSGGGPFSIENLAASASRRSTTSLSSHFNVTVFPGWTGDFTPRVSVSDARTMSAPEQISEALQDSVGADINFKDPHIPFHDFLRPDNLIFDGSYTYAQNWIDNVEVAPYLGSVATSYSLKATLPTRPTDQTTLTMSLATSVSNAVAYQLGLNATDAATFSFTPGLRLVYLYHVVKPIRLPNFWPFYGRELKLTQAIRLDNNLQATINNNSQNATQATLAIAGSDLYTLSNTLSYNVLENLLVNFAFEQDYMVDPYANEAINQPGGYYSIKLSLGAQATF